MRFDGELRTMNILCSQNIIFHKKNFHKSHILKKKIITLDCKANSKEQICYNSGSVTMADTLQQQTCYNGRRSTTCATTVDTLQQ